MVRNFKLLVLVLMIAVSASSILASAASATQFTTTWGATIRATETSQLKFTVTGQTVVCSDVLFQATAFGSSQGELVFSPAFTECKTNLGTTVNFTGFGHLASEAGNPRCRYVFYSTGLFSLDCESGAEVTIDAGPCVTHISEYTLSSGGVKYSDNSAGNDIEMSIESTVTSSHTDGFLCPFGSSGGGTVIMEGSMTVTASVNGVPVDITYDVV